MNVEARAELNAVLPGPEALNARFIEAVDEEIQAYRESTVPFTRQRELDSRRVEKLEAAAAAFAKAVDAASDVGWLIEQKIMMAARRSGMGPDAALAHAESELAALQKSADVARRVAQIAPALKRDARPLKSQAALKSLVTSLAVCFGQTYGYRPSSAGEGNFARAVAVICEVERIPAKSGGKPAVPGQAWLQSVIDAPLVARFPAPKRGRKGKHT